MKKLSLEKGFLILLVGLVGASCSKEATEQPMDQADQTEQVELINASDVAPVSAITTTTTTTSIGTPIGYASYNGTTKGGAGGSAVIVSTFSALKTALASTSPMIITVKGTITGSQGLTVKSNKTIIGASGATLDGPGLLMYGVNNIIVKNLIIKNSVASDAITIKNGSHHIWIDHCTFTSPKYDGLVDITGASDYVTVSWSKFIGASKNTLVGGGDESYTDRGKLHITYHHNFFSNNLERSPSVRFGRVHVFNNYFYDTVTRSGYKGYGMAARIESIVRTDNNYFENFKGNPLVTIDPKPGLFSGATTNVYKNSGTNKISTSASSWKPEYSYSSVLIAAANVPAAVKAGAGAK